MADRKATKGVKELGKKSMKTTKGGGIIVHDFNSQPEPPGIIVQKKPDNIIVQ